MDSFKTVLYKEEILNHVKKSKFIGIVFPCKSVADFEEELTIIKKEHSSANHHCYAYRITDNILVERYQDDKEPTGTAGLPILDVLKGNDLSECAIVVVRYFGGTKLGTGGLSRAYSDAARDVLEIAELVTKDEAYYLTIEVDYHYSGKIEYYINSNEIALMNTEYNNNVLYTIAILSNEYDHIVEDINELSNGQGQLEIVNKTVGFFSKNQFTPN